ncbi:unnamed protein product, partial [Ectocarpus sp. 8 AP-2014]
APGTASTSPKRLVSALSSSSSEVFLEALPPLQPPRPLSSPSELSEDVSPDFCSIAPPRPPAPCALSTSVKKSRNSLMALSPSSDASPDAIPIPSPPSSPPELSEDVSPDSRSFETLRPSAPRAPSIPSKNSWNSLTAFSSSSS